MKFGHRFLALVYATLITTDLAAAPGPEVFADWPANAAPEAVGQPVAERFLASPHAFWPQSGTISYLEF